MPIFDIFKINYQFQSDQQLAQVKYQPFIQLIILLMSESEDRPAFYSEDIDFFYFQPQLSQSGFFINMKRLPHEAQDNVSSWHENFKDDESDGESHQKDDSISPNSQGRSEELTQRVNNTIFKTSLSEYRKSIFDVIKKNTHLQWVKIEVGKAYQSKNFSVFPKLIILGRQLGIDRQIRYFWSKRSKELLSRKQVLLEKKAYSQKRLIQLQKNISNMDLCLSEPLLEVGFQTYWGKYRQRSKFQKSKEQVLLFLQYFKSLLKKKMVQADVLNKIQLKAAPSPENQMNLSDPIDIGLPLHPQSTSDMITS